MGKLELVIETEKVSIYSPRYDGEEHNEFEKFICEHGTHKELQLAAFFGIIMATVLKIQECGARENLFRPEGGAVRAIPLSGPLYVRRKVGKMRLYCLLLSERLLIIGNGGVSTSARYENDPVMLAFVNDMRDIHRSIMRVARQAGTDADDYEGMRIIIESITL